MEAQRRQSRPYFVGEGAPYRFLQASRPSLRKEAVRPRVGVQDAPVRARSHGKTSAILLLLLLLIHPC